jgi:pimeloyl-ACP methyl ester carboxylesterase
MTRWLRRTGHYTRKAGIRTNVDCSSTTIERLTGRLETMAEARGEKVAIVGQSRGGNFAKVLASRRPDLVSGIVTLGSPQLDPMAVHPLIRMQVYAVGTLGTIGAPGFFKHSCLSSDCCRTFWEDLRGPLPKGVGYLSVYSRTDGVIDWRACLDPSAEQLEIRSSHIGMAANAAAYRAVADALASYRGSARRGARRQPARQRQPALHRAA